MTAMKVALVMAGAVLCAGALAGCGSGASTPPSPTSNAPHTGAATTPAAAAGLTPDQVCGLATAAQVSEISGWTVTRTKPELSGDVAVCHYYATVDGFEASKVLLEYSPTGKAAVELTKSRGTAVAGLGQFAVWFQTGAQLFVEVSGDATVNVLVEDVRFHGNNPKDGAIALARIAVAALPHS
jgi:uncharacterized protein DUF3558